MKIGPFTIWTRTVAPSDAAAALAKHGAHLRKTRQREHIISKAVQLCEEGGFPVPDAFR